MRRNYLTGIIVMIVLALFSVAVLGAVLFGAQVYKRISVSSDASYTYRTAAGYISAQIDQTEDKDAIYAESFGDSMALVLPSDHDGIGYTTKIYVNDGMLCELFSPASLLLRAEDGEPMLPMSDMYVSLEDGMLYITLTFESGMKHTIVKGVAK